MKHSLHLRARKQHIRVEDLQLDVQIALLCLPIPIDHQTDVTRTIDIDLELTSYPLTQETIDELNAKRRIHEYRAWYITREDNGVETHITPEQAQRDTAQPEEKSA